MSKRTWWPADWADEIMPPGRDSPDGFIIETAGQFWLGYAFDAPDASAFDIRYFSRGVARGDIVNFICSDDCGEVDVTIAPDGSFTVVGDVPARATHFWEVGNPETLAHSLSEFVENWIAGDSPEKPDTISVGMAWWSDCLPHKLAITYDIASGRSRATFEQVSVAESRQ